MLTRTLALLTRLRIGPRLTLGFLLVAAMCGFLGYTAMGALGEIRAAQVNASGNLLPSALNLGKVRAGALRVQRAERTLIAAGARNDDKGVAVARGNMAAGWRAVDEGSKAYAALPMGDKEAALWKDFQAALAEWRRDHDEIVAHADRRDFAAAQEAAVRELRTADRANDALGESMALQEQIAKEEEAQASAAFAASRTTLWSTLATAVVAAVALGLLLTASVTRPLTRTMGVLEAVAVGDLSKRAEVGSKDETGRMAEALNTAIGALVAAKEAERAQAERDRERAEAAARAEREQAEKEARARQEQADRDAAAAAELRRKVDAVQVAVAAMAAGDFTRQVPDLGDDAVGQMAAELNQAIVSVRTALEGVREVSGQLADASAQLASASEEIATGAQQQASSLEETASTLEEITATVKQNSDSAQQARQLAGGSRDVAERGGQVVGGAVEAMGEINRSSKQIADIITAIDEIAFQTNLLALNAAVEAARAGEQGRGFAVVAAEVRNLAQRSATAAKEIKSLINDSVKKVDAGTELVNRSGATLGEIVTSVKRVTDIVAEIAAASKEQSTGIEQVNKAVTQMDSVTQRNASQTEEMSATAQTLTEQAAQLRDLVARFKLGGEPAAGGPAPAARAGTGRSARGGKPATKLRPAVLKAMANGNGKGHGHELDRLGGDGADGFTDF